MVGGYTSAVRTATLLTGPGQARVLNVVRRSPKDLTLELPAKAPNEIDAVVILTAEGDLKPADPVRLLQPAYPREVLRAFDGELHGGLRFGAGKKSDDWATNWTKPEDAVTWSVRLNEPGTYDVYANFDAGAGAAGNRFVATFGAASVEGVVTEGNNQRVSLGRVELKPGACEVRIAGRDFKGELFRLRHLELQSVAATAR